MHFSLQWLQRIQLLLGWHYAVMTLISQPQYQDTLFFLPPERGSTFLQQSVNFYQTSWHHDSEDTIIYNPCVFNTDNVDRCSLVTTLSPPPSLPHVRTHAYVSTGYCVFLDWRCNISGHIHIQKNLWTQYVTKILMKFKSLLNIFKFPSAVSVT
jgi:hypothetical protein